MQYGVRKSAEDSVFVNVTGASQSSFDIASIFFEGTLSGGFAESGIELQFELAAEYLVMAAILAEIKSRMLLPRKSAEDEDEEDPRAELVRRLQEYERFKQAAEDEEHEDGARARETLGRMSL